GNQIVDEAAVAKDDVVPTDIVDGIRTRIAEDAVVAEATMDGVVATLVGQEGLDTGGQGPSIGDSSIVTYQDVVALVAVEGLTIRITHDIVVVAAKDEVIALATRD